MRKQKTILLTLLLLLPLLLPSLLHSQEFTETYDEFENARMKVFSVEKSYKVTKASTPQMTLYMIGFIIDEICVPSLDPAKMIIDSKMVELTYLKAVQYYGYTLVVYLTSYEQLKLIANSNTAKVKIYYSDYGSKIIKLTHTSKIAQLLE